MKAHSIAMIGHRREWLVGEGWWVRDKEHVQHFLKRDCRAICLASFLAISCRERCTHSRECSSLLADIFDANLGNEAPSRTHCSTYPQR
jgi:hypothetical protein